MMRRATPHAWIALISVNALFALTGCVNIEISEGQFVEILCHGAQQPLAEAYEHRDEQLLVALDRAMTWLESDAGIASYQESRSQEWRYAALFANARLRRHLIEAEGREDFVARVLDDRLFAFPSKVLFTGYFAPEYEASRVRTEYFTVPLYQLPDELRDDRDSVWRTRTEIEVEQLLAGRELAWLADPLDVYLIHVNGSARLRMTDGTIMHVGHSGTNNREYTSIGRLMIDDGRATEEEMSIPTIRRIYEEDSEYVRSLMMRNDRYVFFEEIAADAWPRGGMGMVLTPKRSVAIDPESYPPGSILLVVTELATPDGEFEPFVQLMVAQDVGGAIKGPGRADLFIGVGDEAGEIAGRQVSEGRVYPLLLTPIRE